MQLRLSDGEVEPMGEAVGLSTAEAENLNRGGRDYALKASALLDAETGESGGSGREACDAHLETAPEAT